MNAAIYFVSARYDIDKLTVRRAEELLSKVCDQDRPAVVAYIRKERPDLNIS